MATQNVATDACPVTKDDEQFSKLDGHEASGLTKLADNIVEQYVDNDEIESYLMNHAKRGKAVIFNHEKFDIKGLDSREGTQIDRDRIAKCLKALGFEVEVYNDLGKLDVLIKLLELKAEDHSDRDSLVIIVLSHGVSGKIFAKDEFYRPEELWNPFTAEKCRSLAGKPKLFFIQACRGESTDQGTKLKACRTHHQPDSEPMVSGLFSYIVPNWADFLIAFSTPPGYVSWRSHEKGSWFIDSLVTVLQTESQTEDLLTMMTDVTRMVSRSYTSTNSKKELNNKKQVPMICSTLRKLLYFSDTNV